MNVWIKMNLNTYESFTLVKKLQQLQEERIYTYHLFNEGHKLFFKSGYNHEPFIRFRQLVHEVTQEFKRISEEIVNIEKRFRNDEFCIEIADLILAVQEDEKNKLHLTASIQLAKQRYFTHPDQYEFQLDVILLRKRLNEVMTRINENLSKIQSICDNKI